KYLKAVLLLNRKSAKAYGHDIAKLYANVRPLAPELFPTTLAKPEARMPDEYWHREGADDFIKRLYRDGYWRLSSPAISSRPKCQKPRSHSRAACSARWPCRSFAHAERRCRGGCCSTAPFAISLRVTVDPLHEARGGRIIAVESR